MGHQLSVFYKPYRAATGQLDSIFGPGHIPERIKGIENGESLTLLCFLVTYR